MVRWNLKEAVSKSLVRRTEITYKARLREISWPNSTKSNNYHFCSSRVNVADILHIPLNQNSLHASSVRLSAPNGKDNRD